MELTLDETVAAVSLLTRYSRNTNSPDYMNEAALRIACQLLVRANQTFGEEAVDRAVNAHVNLGLALAGAQVLSKNRLVGQA